MKTKFKATKAKKIDLEKKASATREEVVRLRSLVETEEAKLANLEGGMKVADQTISNIGTQAMQKGKALASTKVEAGKWSTLVAKAQRNRENIE